VEKREEVSPRNFLSENAKIAKNCIYSRVAKALAFYVKVL
jgi:hypothetical protein